MLLKFTLNGKAVEAECPPGMRAVDLLREHFALTGVKEGCSEGECGACSILVGNASRLSCLMLACQLEGQDIVTVEGLQGENGVLHPVQQAFVDQGAVQCGYCSPGMLISALDLLARNPRPSRVQIREGLSGNLCRCTGYQKIIDAVEAASLTMAGDGDD